MEADEEVRVQSKGEQNVRENTENVTGEQSKDLTDQNSENKPPEEPYAENYLRVSKDNLYMIIALWMEDFVDDAPESHRKVGAVLVLPNDVSFAADCSQGGVHAAARLLMKHGDKAKGSKMFMSRKPCPFCAKLMVQMKVERVLFLPFEPEYYRSPPESRETEDKKKVREKINESNRNQVDNLFTASPIAQTKFVLQVEKPVVEREKEKTPEEKSDEVEMYKTRLMTRYRSFKTDSEWMKRIQVELPWPAFDNDMKKQFTEYFEEVVDWMARVLIRQGKWLEYSFQLCKLSKKPPPNKELSVKEKPPAVNEDFDPAKTHEKQAQHFMTIAHFLSQRTDDPKQTGVGAVIVNSKKPMEILALGWNGFPLKANYGEFARASHSNTSSDDKKYPYIIHAEQNALLMRNKKNIKDGAILFVTKPPCNECAPLIDMMEGIKIVVVNDEVKHREKPKPNELGYDVFPKMVENGRFICYETKQKMEGVQPSEKTSRQIDYKDAENK